MEHKEALLDSLAELRTAHDKASRAMADIAATGARALKGSDSLPSLGQLRTYAQALAQAQRQLSRCQDLLQGRPIAAGGAELASGRSYVH
jgi:aspartate ammonia-lyase